MGLFDLLKKTHKKPHRDKKLPDNSSLTDIDGADRSSEDGLDDTENLSTLISSGSENGSKYKSAYENIIMDQKRRVLPPDQNRTNRFFEKNNIGIRIRSMIEKSSQNLKIELFEKEVRQQFQPYIRYLFANAEDARDALLGLNFIHEAEDTGNLICTEPLTFGCYRQQNGKHEAYIGGWQLTPRLWKAAKESFTVHNGLIKNEQRPDAEFNSNTKRGMTLSERVTKIREYSQLNSGQTEFYSIYEAPNGVIAQAFLKQQQNLITKSDWYIVVKTPDGDFWGDIDGIYKK
ncbi:hypothetical protein QUF90_09745 [Desulfococcaceae bacterium HSG9]|nr:hypothetical protein [Desulfococcaceae bacterium HSG9]